MAIVPGAEFDVFISYSWADNQSGWVDRFENALTERVHVLLGQKPNFFRDLRELSGEKDFTLEIQTRLEKSAALVAVLSPGYFQSDYCRMERNHYVAHVDGGLEIGTRVKLIKAIKLPHPKGLHRSFVNQAFGFPFHTDPPEVVEYLPGEVNFSQGIDKLAKGLSQLLDDIANSKAKIYVAEPVPPALTVIWQRLRNQLGKKGFQLLPADRLDTFIDSDYIAREMHDAALTVHLLAPQVSDFSRQQLQLAQQLGKPTLLWVPPGQPLSPLDEEFLATLSHLIRLQVPDWRLENVVMEEARKELDRQAAPAAPATGQAQSIYLICDRTDPADTEAATQLAQHLTAQGFAVYLPDTERDPAILDELHRQRLNDCDGILFYWGQATAPWFHENYGDFVRVYRRKAVPAGLISPDPARQPEFLALGLAAFLNQLRPRA